MDPAELQTRATRATALLKAMSNASRLLILCQLAGGEKTVGEIQRRIGLSQPGISQHLALLRRKGIVATRRAARSVYYSLASREVEAVMATLYREFCTAGKTRRPSAR